MDDWIELFSSAASVIIKEELDILIQKRTLDKESGNFLTDEIAVIINIIGDWEGQLFFEMRYDTALNVVNRMLNDNSEQDKEVVLSAVAEMANVIAGRISIYLESAGNQNKISPPTVLVGRNVIVSTVKITRYKIHMTSGIGDFILRIGLKPGDHNEKVPVSAPLSA